MRIVYNDRHVMHATHEIDRRPNDLFEIPARVEAICDAVRDAGLGAFHLPEDHGMEPILTVHNADYVAFLQEAYERNSKFDGQRSPLYPDIFPTRHAMRLTRHLPGPAGYYAADADTPILEQTWEAAYWSAQCALTTADIVLSGDPVAFALCRPPGHHAYEDLYGGFCYLNNVAVAARYLQSMHEPPVRVAILDIDFHHGNGTQSIFYSDPTVLLCSLHGHPDSDYPYYSGMPDERGAGAGEGYNRNWPLPRGVTGPTYLAALEEALLAIREFAPGFLIVSAGFDISAGDPYGRFLLTLEDLQAIGGRIASQHLPTVLVQEGGYLLPDLGRQAVAFLTAFV